MRNNVIHLAKFLTSVVILFLLALLILGGCYPKIENSAESAQITNKDITDFFSTVRRVDGQAESHYKMAIYLQQRKRHKMAIEEFSKAIQCAPTMTRAYNAMGISYDKLRNYERAVYCYKLALKIDPTLDYVYNNLGFSYFIQGKLDSAINAFKNAIELNEQKKQYHNNLGLAYARKGLFNQAFDEFVLGTDKGRAHVNLGKIYYNLAQYEKSKFHFAEASKGDLPSLKSQKVQNEAEIVSKTKRKEKSSIHGLSEGLSDEGKENIFTTELKVKTDFDTENVKISKTSGLAKSRKHTGRMAPLTHNISLIQTPEYFSEQAGGSAHANQSNNTIIEISNGNGIPRMAKRVGNYLKIKGAEVTRLTNAHHFNFTKTKIYYQEAYLHEAYKIAKEIPGFQNMEKKSDLNLNNVHIKVLIGKDLIFYDKYFTRQCIQAKNLMSSKFYESKIYE
jgi:tetratricopeptide (TPR) repeat protein